MENKFRNSLGLTLVCTFNINGQEVEGRGNTVEEAKADALKKIERKE